MPPKTLIPIRGFQKSKAPQINTPPTQFREEAKIEIEDGNWTDERAMQEENSKLVAELGGDRRVIETGVRSSHVGTLRGIPVVVVFSQWGKVAAATTATCLIAEFNVGEIIFTGVAGGAASKVRVGDVVVTTGLCQHDMDARPLFLRYEIPLIGRSTFPTDIVRRLHAVEAAKSFFLNALASQIDTSVLADFGIVDPRAVEGQYSERRQIHSGDGGGGKELKSRLQGKSCVEMEGAAVAQVC